MVLGRVSLLLYRFLFTSEREDGYCENIYGEKKSVNTSRGRIFHEKDRIRDGHGFEETRLAPTCHSFPERHLT